MKLSVFSYQLRLFFSTQRHKVHKVSQSKLLPLATHHSPLTSHLTPLTSYLIPLIVFCFLPSALFAQKQEIIDTQSKEFTKSYDVKPQDLLVLNSSYAKVTFEEWEKNKVEFVATITLEQSTEKDMELLLSYLNITHTQFGGKVNYNLAINDLIQKRKYFYETDKKMNNIKKNMEINLNVKIPKDIFMVITSKYGDVKIENLYHDFEAKVTYGNLNINNLYGSSNIDMRYGNLNANSFSKSSNEINIKYGDIIIDNLPGSSNNIDINYGKLKIKKVYLLTLSAKYSKGEMNEVGTLKLDSRYCTFKINNVNIISLSSNYDKISVQKSIDKIEGNMKYGTLNINSLTNSCVLRSFSHSTIIIDEVLPSFTNISILSSYSNIKVNIPQEQSFNFDYSGKYTDFKDKNIKLNDATFEAGSNSILMSGIYGSQRYTGKTVKVEASFGSVSLFGK